MYYLNIFCYICTSFFAIIMVYSYVLKPILDRIHNQEVVNDRTAKKETGTRYFKFNYNGPVFIEAKGQKSATNKFRGFKRDQLKMGKLYGKGKITNSKKS